MTMALTMTMTMTMTMIAVTFEIYRYQGDEKPYVQMYEIDTKQCGPMILDALILMYVPCCSLLELTHARTRLSWPPKKQQHLTLISSTARTRLIRLLPSVARAARVSAEGTAWRLAPVFAWAMWACVCVLHVRMCVAHTHKPFLTTSLTHFVAVQLRDEHCRYQYAGLPQGTTALCSSPSLPSPPVTATATRRSR